MVLQYLSENFGINGKVSGIIGKVASNAGSVAGVVETGTEAYLIYTDENSSEADWARLTTTTILSIAGGPAGGVTMGLYELMAEATKGFREEGMRQKNNLLYLFSQCANLHTVPAMLTTP